MQNVDGSASPTLARITLLHDINEGAVVPGRAAAETIDGCIADQTVPAIALSENLTRTRGVEDG
ncbi:MAG TPA: hypothetical protein VJP88_01010 [Caulobacteraceae bacterium]|nr:hypothetical protein [Caulobacteraceae bacterium]